MPRSIVKEVEAEYGEPFWDVVRGFAEDGHSVTATAKLLGYSHSAVGLVRLMKRKGIEIDFARGQESIFSKQAREDRKGSPATAAQLAATKRASENNPHYIYVEYLGVKDTLTGHSRRMGISYDTIRKRYKANKSPDYIFKKGSHRNSPPKGKGWQSKENRFTL